MKTLNMLFNLKEHVNESDNLPWAKDRIVAGREYYSLYAGYKNDGGHLHKARQ